MLTTDQTKTSPEKNHGQAPAPVDDPRAIRVLYEIASQATREGDPREALQAMLDCTAETLRSTSGYIALLDPDSGKLEIEVQKNLPPDAHEFLLRPGQGITGWVFFHAKAQNIADVTTDSRYISLRKETRSRMVAPLEDNGRVLGVITLDHDMPGVFNEADFALFERFAREIAAVITRLWQLRQLQGKARQLETLITIGQTLVSKVEQQELLTAIARDAQTITQSHACALYLYHPENAAITLESLATVSDKTSDKISKTLERNQQEIPLDSSLVASVIHTRRQLEFANVRTLEYDDLNDIPRDEKLRSVLASPMICEGELLGVLAIFTDRIHRFNNDEKRLLDALASLGAVAIQNARLYSRVFKSEALLRKNEQLTTLGLLAAEIAHEIRNPLTVIKLLYGYLGLDFPENDPRRTDVRVIGEKLDQLEAIVTRVLNFAKAPSSLHSRWAIADVVDDTIVLIRLKFAQQNIQLNYETPPRHWLVTVNKGQIQQVLLNLLLNSMQAMPNGGRIAINITTSEHMLHIDIVDNGSGIPTKVRTHIFDSFLSGRPDGTGLGLAIAKRIMIGHHGDISLVESGSQGTTFRVTLPMVS